MTTWLEYRDALTAQLNGLKSTAPGFDEETLLFLNRPPAAMQETFPYGWLIPPARTVTPLPNAQTKTSIGPVRARFLLSAEDIEEAAERMEAWIPVISAAIGAHIQAGQGGAYTTTRHFSEFSSYGPSEGLPPYGFDLELPVTLIDTEARGA